MKKFLYIWLTLALFMLLTGCNGAEPKVEWHSQLFTAMGDEYYYEGTIHNGGAGTAKDVEITLLFPEDLVQRKRSDVNPIQIGEVGPEEIATYSGKILFDLENLDKSQIMDLLKDLEVKIRWTEDGTTNEDFLRRKEDIENKQAQ